jgi:hypothetical protein
MIDQRLQSIFNPNAMRIGSMLLMESHQLS